ncbi:MAG TPA: hypothetical protein VHA52_09945 [Candidatus Babeliaceae bacterium]|nr:hypothetical protein [Candidatus Babeliaceae bacterium]
MEAAIFPLTSLAGVQRDGTAFASRYYRDSQHCRFDAPAEGGQAMARKMGGYRKIIEIPEVVRGVLVVPSATLPAAFNVYIGTPNNLYVFLMNFDGTPLSALNNITPVDFQGSDDNIWQFGVMYSTTFSATSIIAHAAPNLESISQNTATQVYYGALDAIIPFVPLGGTNTEVSGGVAVLHPYLFIFGSEGEIQWSQPNNPTNFPLTNINRASGLKIVAGMQTRGGNSPPAGIFWTLSSVVRVTFVGEPGTFKFDEISSKSSILSSSSIVADEDSIYWIGTKNFCVYNGTVKELPNNMNRQYFFRNLNYNQVQKVWATKIPQWGEIWWFYPSGTSEECDRAVIFNTRLNKWYDTKLDRISGYFPQVFKDPLWASPPLTEGGAYILWQHEIGVDQNTGTLEDPILSPIESYFETGDIAWCAVSPSGEWVGKDRWVDLQKVEPDLIQTGEMTLSVRGRPYARAFASESVYSPYSFDPLTEKIDMREQAREMTLKFTSNEIGGFYYMGNTLLHFRLGDVRA